MEQEARKFYQRMILWQIFAMIGIVIAFVLFLLGNFYASNTDGIFVAYFFAILMFIFGVKAGQASVQCRMVQKSYGLFHDYLALRLSHVKNQKAKNNMMILMAKCDIVTNRYERAAQTLCALNCYELRQDSQAVYYLMWYIIDHLTGKEEEAEKNLQTYRQMTEVRTKRALPYRTKRLQAIASGNEYELIHLMDFEEAFSFNKKVLRALTGIFFLLSTYLAFYVIEQNLPAGFFFRTNLVLIVYSLYAVAFCVLLLLLVIYRVRIRQMAEWKTTGTTVLGTIAIILAGMFLLVYGLLLFLMLDSEKKMTDDKILVRKDYFLDPCEYAVYEPYHILFRKYLYESDENGNHLQEKLYAPRKSEADTSEMESEQEEDLEQGTDLEQGDGESEIKEMYQKIYELYFASGYDDITYAYSAKGELYALLGNRYEAEVNGETVMAQMRLVYDRESENGACEEFVCYEDHYDDAGNPLDNSSIFNFYAVKKDTLEVIPANKTSWAQRGSEEYCEATGE